MMRRIIIFISGTFLLSAAWLGVTSSVKRSQDSLQQETVPIKFGLVQSRWEKLANFEAVIDGKIAKPADFVFEFSGMDLELVKSTVSREITREAYLDIKRAYLDAGPKAMFFTVDLRGEGPYLIRISKINEQVEATGFPLDAMLNYLGQGLERDEWHLIDGRRRVVASSEKSYVGESYKIHEGFRAFKFDVSGSDYLFATLRPTGVNLALVNFMGVLGIFLIFFALYVYTGEVEEEKKIAEADPLIGTDLFESLDLDKSSSQILEQASGKQKDLGDRIFEDTISEDIRMVDLTVNKQGGLGSGKLDYTEFLIENPLLGEAPTQTESKVVASEANLAPERGPENTGEIATDEKEDLLMGSSADDWIKLAEDLSANIDKFTKSLEEGDSLEGGRVKIEKVDF